MGETSNVKRLDIQYGQGVRSRDQKHIYCIHFFRDQGLTALYAATTTAPQKTRLFPFTARAGTASFGLPWKSKRTNAF